MACPHSPGAPDSRRGGSSRGEDSFPELGVHHFLMRHRSEGRGLAGLWEKQNWPSVI